MVYWLGATCLFGQLFVFVTAMYKIASVFANRYRLKKLRQEEFNDLMYEQQTMNSDIIIAV